MRSVRLLLSEITVMINTVLEDTLTEIKDTQSRIAPFFYRQLQNGLYYCIVNGTQRDSVDGFFNAMTEIYDYYDKNPLGPDERIKILFNGENGEMPVGYTFSTYRRWNPTRENHHAAQLAIVSGSPLITAMFNITLRGMRVGHLQTRMFHAGQIPQALEWLYPDSR